MGLDDCEGGTVDGIGGDDSPARRGREHAVATDTGDQVHADQVGDVARPGPRGDVGEGAGLRDRASLEDDDPVGERVGVDGVVGDEQAHAVERGEVSPQVSPHVGAGAGVERGKRLVEQEQARLGRRAPGRARLVAPDRRRARPGDGAA